MKRHYSQIFVLSAFILSLYSLSLAEIIVLEEIIVSGERVINPEESLDIKDVRESPVRDVGEALKSVEGLTSIRRGAIANDIAIRGFQKDNINVMIDGIRLYGACPNRMDPTSFHVDFEEVQEISVLKGPFDVQSPGNLGGLINIKTIKPQKGWNVNFNSLFGSWENINSSVHVAHGGDNYSALFGYSYKYSLPYKDGDGDRITEQYPSNSPNRYKDDEKDDRAYSINTYWTKHSFNSSDNHKAEISYSRQEADDIMYPYLLMDADYDNTDRLNLTFEFSNLFKMNEKTKCQFYLNQVRHEMTDSRRVSSIGFPSGYMMKTFAETHTHGGNIAVELDFYQGVLNVGSDYYLRNWETETTLPTGIQDSIPDVDLSNIGAFMDYSQSIDDKIKIGLGMRFDSTKAKAKEDRSSLYLIYHGTTDREETDSYFSGNIKFTFMPISNWELFSGFGLSARPPDAVERYFALVKPMAKPNWVGNPKLDPVKNREFDIGLKYSGEPFQLKLTLFYSDIDDFITIYDTGTIGIVKNAKSYRNVDATVYGSELSFSTILPLQFKLEGGLSYTRGQDDSFDKPLSEIPPLRGRLAISYEMEKYFVELEGIFSDDQSRVDEELNEESTSGWGLMNLKAGLKYKKWRIVTGVQNIFDKLYSEHLSYQRDPFRSGIRVPEIGRNIYISLSYAF